MSLNFHFFNTDALKVVCNCFPKSVSSSFYSENGVDNPRSVSSVNNSLTAIVELLEESSPVEEVALHPNILPPAISRNHDGIVELLPTATSSIAEDKPNSDIAGAYSTCTDNTLNVESRSLSVPIVDQPLVAPIANSIAAITSSSDGDDWSSEDFLAMEAIADEHIKKQLLQCQRNFPPSDINQVRLPNSRQSIFSMKIYQ